MVHFIFQFIPGCHISLGTIVFLHWCFCTFRSARPPLPFTTFSSHFYISLRYHFFSYSSFTLTVSSCFHPFLPSISHKAPLPIQDTNLHCNYTKSQEAAPAFSRRATRSPAHHAGGHGRQHLSRASRTPFRFVVLRRGRRKVDRLEVSSTRFAVLLPSTVFLSGETWATLWEVVVLASIRGQLQC